MRDRFNAMSNAPHRYYEDRLFALEYEHVLRVAGADEIGQLLTAYAMYSSALARLLRLVETASTDDVSLKRDLGL